MINGRLNGAIVGCLNMKRRKPKIPHLNKWIIEKLRRTNAIRSERNSTETIPRNQSEDLGDDAMLASSYGIKNLKRVMPEIA